MRIIAVLLTLVWLVTGSPASAGPQALVLNNFDNTLSSIDLATGTGSLGEFTFSGFPNRALIAGNRLYVVASGSNEVYVLDVDTRMPIDTVSTGAGTNPYDLAVDGAGNLYVSLFNTNELARFNSFGEETGRVTVGRSPQGVLLHGGRLFVANTGFRFSDFGYDPGTLSVLDPGTLASLGSIAVGTNPQRIEPVGSTLHVICTGNFVDVFGEVHVVDPAGLVSTAVVSMGGSPGYLETGGGFGYVSDYFGGITIYETATGQVVRDATNPILIPGASGYSGLALDGSGGLLVALFDNDVVARIDLATQTLDTTFPTGDGPLDLVLHAGGPVPVRLLDFRVQGTAHGTRLIWAVTDPAEAAGFRVDRRSGSGPWVLVAELPAGVKAWIDPEPAPPLREYRLSVRLRNGTVRELGIREAEPGGTPAFRLLANPVRETLRLRATGPWAGPVRVEVFDVLGRRLRSTSGENAVTDWNINVSGFPAGVYLVRMGTESQSITHRFSLLP